jgi:hypothetical protein
VEGIAPEDRERIFERFVRAKQATSRRVRGSGIGLALVRYIAEADGGKAWVEGAMPQGAAVIFTIRAGAGRVTSMYPKCCQVPRGSTLATWRCSTGFAVGVEAVARSTSCTRRVQGGR